MTTGPYVKPDRPSPEQIDAWSRMSYAQKLALSDELRTMAIRLCEARLRRERPGLTDDEIRVHLREVVLHGVA